MKHFFSTAIIALLSVSALSACQTMVTAPVSIVSDEDIKNSHKRTRLLTLVYHWLALIEDPNHTAEPFKDIIAEDINFDFSSGPITDFQGLSDWLYGTASSVAYSRHVLSNFTFKTLDTDLYEIEVDMDWHGLLPDGQRMAAKTHHTWIVTDNKTERFARIQKINVELIEPFRVVEE